MLFDALRSGDLDVYVDYSGTLWATILRRDGPPPARDVVLREVREALARDHGVRVVAALGFENTYALAMRRDLAKRLGVKRFSDLARHAPDLKLGSDYEFFDRPEWYTLRETYGLKFEKLVSMDSTK